MNTIVYNEIELCLEAATLLEYLATEEQPLHMKKNLINKYGVSPELLEEPFGVCAKLVTEGKKRLKPNMDKVKEYFIPYMEDGAVSKAHAAMLLDSNCYGESLSQRKEACLAYSEERRSLEFYYLIQGTYGMDAELDTEESRKCKSLREVLECLEESDFSPEQKWELQWVYNHPQQAWDEVEPLMQAAIEVLQENESLWRPLVEQFCNSWEERIKKQSVQEYIKEQVGYELEESPVGTVVQPLIMGTNQLQVAVKPEGEIWGDRTPDIFRFGVAIERIGIRISQPDAGAQKKYTASLLKILSDESKLEILSLLKERRYYGGELAKKLNLTTATISHHMTILVSNGLVTVNKEMNRIYYELNVEIIQRLLDQTREMLLKE